MSQTATRPSAALFVSSATKCQINETLIHYNVRDQNSRNVSKGITRCNSATQNNCLLSGASQQRKHTHNDIIGQRGDKDAELEKTQVGSSGVGAHWQQNQLALSVRIVVGRVNLHMALIRDVSVRQARISMHQVSVSLRL